MKQLLFFFSLVLIAFTANGQNFEGKIIFELETSNAQVASMLPKETVTYIKGEKSRMELNMMGTKNSTIADAKAGTSVALMDMMGQKYAIVPSAADEAEAQKVTEQVKVKTTKETKTIAGYKCTKAMVEIPVKGGEAQKMDVWYTKDLAIGNGYVKGLGSKIDGTVLQFTINQNGIDMTFKAKEVVKEKVSDDLFTVPAEYKQVTQEELMKALGGGR